MTNEVWKPVVSWEGIYSVSDMGRVRSERRVIHEKRPDNWKPKSYVIKERILKPIKYTSGHFGVSLSANSKAKIHPVHRLVLCAFVGDCPDGHEVCHGDGDPTNNRLENLRYGTRSENIADAKRHGTFPIGSARPGAKLNDEKALEIYNLADSEISSKEAGEIFGIKPRTVNQIWRGETWRHITGGQPTSRVRKKRFDLLSKEDKHFLMNNKYDDIIKKLSISRDQIKRYKRQIKEGL